MDHVSQLEEANANIAWLLHIWQQEFLYMVVLTFVMLLSAELHQIHQSVKSPQLFHIQYVVWLHAAVLHASQSHSAFKCTKNCDLYWGVSFEF